MTTTATPTGAAGTTHEDGRVVAIAGPVIERNAATGFLAKVENPMLNHTTSGSAL